MLRIVPNILRDRIDALLDAAYEIYPDAAIDREIHYQRLLDYFDEHGVIPDFQLAKREEIANKLTPVKGK